MSCTCRRRSRNRSWFSVKLRILGYRPRKRLGEFTSLATADSVKAKVRKRVDQFGEAKLEWYNGIFLPQLESMSVGSLAWEALLNAMESEGAGSEFRQFYQKCSTYANL